MSTKEENYLKFLYEGCDEFCVLPTFGVIPGMSAMDVTVTTEIPGLKHDLVKVNCVVRPQQSRPRSSCDTDLS